MPDDPESRWAANRRYWDASTPRKMDAGSYPLEAFRDGESTLFAHEREEVGDVAGRTLLHLQCNNGLETLSWAREGADVTGIDISGESLRYARDLAADAGLDADFVQCNVHDVDSVFSRAFDVVYTSRGVLPWIDDLDDWAGVVADVLAPDGVFYCYEGHPLADVFDGDLEPVRSYFASEPRRHDESDFGVDAEHYQTLHGLGDVVSALSAAGLDVEFVREFPFDFWRRWERMVPDERGRWTLPDDPVPLSFSVRAGPR